MLRQYYPLRVDLISRLKLTNFRGIKQGEVDLSPLTVLVGSNNSAKTTLLEAIYLTQGPFHPAPYTIPNPTPIGQPNQGSNVLNVLAYLHKTLNDQFSGATFLLHNYVEKEAEITLDGGTYTLRIILTNPYTAVFIASTPNSNTQITIGERKITGLNLGAVGPSQVQLAAPPQPPPGSHTSLFYNPQLIKEGVGFLYNNWVSLVNSGVSKTVAQEVSELSNDEYVDLTAEPFVGGTNTLYAYTVEGRRIRLGDVGQGIQSYIVVRMLYEYTKPQILLWDDVESHMNPRVLLKIADWFTTLISQGVQVVVSTHSLETVNTLLQTQEHARALLLSLNKGALGCKALDREYLEKLMTAGIDVRAAEGLPI